MSKRFKVNAEILSRCPSLAKDELERMFALPSPRYAATDDERKQIADGMIHEARSSGPFERALMRAALDGDESKFDQSKGMPCATTGCDGRALSRLAYAGRCETCVINRISSQPQPDSALPMGPAEA